MTLLLDQGEEATGLRWQASQQFQALPPVLDHVSDPAIVIVGSPGSGKSTLLRHYELDCAQEGLAALAGGANAEELPLTFFLPLSSYKPARSGEPLPPPEKWLIEQWQKLAPDLPPLEVLLRQGRMTLLLDAFNEIPMVRAEAGRLWKGFLQDLAQNYPRNRAIFSCRYLDYGALLSTKDLPVPQVRIEPLSDDQVRQFLKAYRPEYSGRLWQNLESDPKLLDVLRSPYFLKLLVAQTQAGEVPGGPAALFTGFVRQALRREVIGDHSLFQEGELLRERDIERLKSARRWRLFDLPERGMLIPQLESLAYQMQSQVPAGEGGQVRIQYEEALKCLNPGHSKEILKAGEALGVLEEDLGRNEVLYAHQLMQEYFAARQLAQAPKPELVHQAWQADQVKPSLEDTLATLAVSDPLPPLPGSGWEETIRLAAAMAPNPEEFITELMAHNLPLAGRCGASPEVKLSEELKNRLRQALLARTQGQRADLRARIDAGFVLGEIGDPRFERDQGPDGDYLLPPLIEIPGGIYPLGSDEGFDQTEAPAHWVKLQPFRIAQFPVTNREWTLFMQAGGYDDARWWDTEEAQAWQRSERTAEGSNQEWQKWWNYFQENPARIYTAREAGYLTSRQTDIWELLVQLTEAEFETWLEKEYPPGRQTHPLAWNEAAFNQPVQPVVGISWYEARAYCAWLRAQTGQPFRLPTEAEWEAAARGKPGRRYVYGDKFEPSLGNTFETRIGHTTPIGVFPGGGTPEEVMDMTGNVWEWTRSHYKPYPYQATDGREAPHGIEPRVVRGGSWGNSLAFARAAYRFCFYPDFRDRPVGFRVVCSSLL